MKEKILQFVNEYTKNLALEKRINSSKKYYDILINQLPIELKASNLFSDKYKIEGSAGKGNLAQCPWLGIFNKDITETATYGLYVVYLFSSDLKRVYLTLNQGFTTFRNLFKKDKYVYISKTAKYFADEIDTIDFDIGPISLGKNLGDLAKGYELGTIIYKKYEIDSLPIDSTLISDLSKIMKIYDELFLAFGNKKYNDVIKLINDIEDELNLSDALNMINSEIDKTFIIPHDAVINPKMVEKKEIKSDKFLKIRDSMIRKKTDYINIAKTNERIGLQGEKLVLEIEKDRLTKLGIKDIDSKVRWLSNESDSYGYDIESVDIINGKEVSIFIEVKTTSNKTDIPFLITKKEKEVSENKNILFRIYRIYDCDSLEPKYYIAEGKVEDNFYVDAFTYQAIYKYKV